MFEKHPKHTPRPGVDTLGRTELHYVAADGDATKVKALLDAGSDPSAADNNGWTPLHFACQGKRVDVVHLLLDAGASVDPRDSHGNTPLFKAVFNSHGAGEIIGTLRRTGADPSIQNASGVSPVKLARTIANYDVRQYFSDLPDEHT